VSPEADIQSVCFTQEEAEAVADCLNKLHARQKQNDFLWGLDKKRKPAPRNA
jgi:hypothetical protein